MFDWECIFMLIHVHIILVYCVVYIETDRQTDRQKRQKERERWHTDA